MAAAAAATKTPELEGKALDDALTELGYGVAFKKHAFGSESVDPRDLWFRKAESTLHWGPNGKRGTDSSRTMKVADITEVGWGRTTATFEKKSAAKADERRCVSITTKKRSLDCEFDSEEKATLFVGAVMGVLKRVNAKSAYKSKLTYTPAAKDAPAAAGAPGPAGAKLERIDTHADLAAAGAADGKSAPAAAASPTAAAPAAAAPAAAAPAAPDADEPVREKFFADVTAAGKTSGIEFFVIVSKPTQPGAPGDAKCFHATSRAIGPREFGHLDAAVRASTTLLNLQETAPNPADVQTKQRLAECKSEIEATRKALAETLEQIAKLEAPAAAAAPADAAAAGAAGAAGAASS